MRKALHIRYFDRVLNKAMHFKTKKSRIECILPLEKNYGAQRSIKRKLFFLTYITQQNLHSNALVKWKLFNIWGFYEKRNEKNHLVESFVKPHHNPCYLKFWLFYIDKPISLFHASGIAAPPVKIRKPLVFGYFQGE